VLSSNERRLSEADVVAFTDLTGDRHPLHRPSPLASASRWGEPIVPGLLVLCFSIGLLEIDVERVIALHSLREVVFARPTRFDETIRVEAKVLYTHPIRPGVVLAGLRWLVRGRAGPVLVRARVELLWDQGSERASADAAG
jgi:acyl dehydratase